MAFLSQAPPLGGLLPPHGAFQEHAAHPPRWPGELSSKGSSDTCISAGVFHIPMPCFHGARNVSDNNDDTDAAHKWNAFLVNAAFGKISCTPGKRGKAQRAQEPIAMELYQLRTFIVVAEEGNVTRA